MVTWTLAVWNLRQARELVGLKGDVSLSRHVERVFNPDQKDKHWGKRKLKRDELGIDDL
jgi:hypothetical protein